MQVDLIADLQLVEVLDLRARRNRHEVSLLALERHVARRLVDGGDGRADLDRIGHDGLAGRGCGTLPQFH